MILLDTTILCYAVGADHPLRQPCVRILAATERLELATTVDVLQEFAHVRARRRSREDAASLARSYASLLLLLPTEPADLERGLDLFCRHADLGAFDAVLAAAALQREAEALISADRAFGAVPGLPYIDPAGPALDALLG